MRSDGRNYMSCNSQCPGPQGHFSFRHLEDLRCPWWRGIDHGCGARQNSDMTHWEYSCTLGESIIVCATSTACFGIIINRPNHDATNATAVCEAFLEGVCFFVTIAQPVIIVVREVFHHCGAVEIGSMLLFVNYLTFSVILRI